MRIALFGHWLVWEPERESGLQYGLQLGFYTSLLVGARTETFIYLPIEKREKNLAILKGFSGIQNHERLS